MTEPSPADELKAAVRKLRPSSPAVAAHTSWVKIRPEAAEALADLMEEQARSLESFADHTFCPTYQCARNAALATARAINRAQP